MIIDNPEFIRLARSKLRIGRLALMFVIGALVCCGLLVLFYIEATSFGQHPMLNPARMFHGYFYWIAGLQLTVISLLGTMLSAQNIALERERSTLDFQRLVGMGPWRLAVGKLFGGATEALFMAGVGSLFALIAVVGGGVSISIYMQVQLCMFVCFLHVSAFGLVCSSVTDKTSNAMGLAVLMAMGYGIATVFIVAQGGMSILAAANPVSVLTTLYQQSPSGFQFKTVPIDFDYFGVHVPMLVGFCMVNLLQTWACFVITARRLASDEFSYISLRHAVITFVLIELILIGGVISEPAGNIVTGFGHPGLVAFHGVNACVLMALAFLLSPNAELFRARLYRAVRDEHWKVVFERSSRLDDASPLAAIILFSLAYALIAVVVAVVQGRNETANFAVIPMVAGMGIATASLLVYLHVYLEKNSFKAAIGLLIAAFAIPPFIVAVLKNWEHALLVSPPAYIGQLGKLIEKPDYLQSYDGPSGNAAIWSCPMICTALGVMFFVLVAMRIRFLLDLHERQRKLEAEADRKADAKIDPSTAAARLLATAPAPIPLAVPTQTPSAGSTQT